MLLKHTLFYLPAQIIGPAIQFMSIIIWAYLLTPTDLGIVTLTLAVQEISFALFFAWWSLYALRFISSFAGPERRRVFLQGEAAALLISLIGQFIVGGAAIYLYFSTTVSMPAIVGMIAFVLTRSVNNYMSERARAEANIALYTFIQTAGPLLGLILGLAFCYLFVASSTTILLGFTIVQLLTTFIAGYRSDFATAWPVFRRKTLLDATRFGMPVMASQLLALIATNAPRFIVENAMGLEAVGIFSVGYGLGLRASSVAVMLVTAGAYPLVVRKMELEGVIAAYEQLKKNITLVALVVTPVAFGLLAINAQVVDLLVPANYRAATYLILPFATIGGLMRYLRAHTSDQVFLVRSRTMYIAVIAVIDLIFAVLSTYIGLHLYGMGGAAVGPMVSGTITFTASLILSRVVLDFHFPVKAMVAILLAAVIMAAGVYFTPAPGGFFGLSLRIVVGAVIYAIFVWAFLPVARQLADKITGRCMHYLRGFYGNA